MLRKDGFHLLEIGDGAGDLEDSVVGPGRKAEFFDRLFQDPSPLFIDGTESSKPSPTQLTVAMKPYLRKSSPLDLPGC